MPMNRYKAIQAISIAFLMSLIFVKELSTLFEGIIKLESEEMDG